MVHYYGVTTNQETKFNSIALHIQYINIIYCYCNNFEVCILFVII